MMLSYTSEEYDAVREEGRVGYHNPYHPATWQYGAWLGGYYGSWIRRVMTENQSPLPPSDLSDGDGNYY